MIMKNLFLFLGLCLSAVTYSQDDGDWFYSVGNEVYTEKILHLPIVRNINGGTIINVEYVGDKWTNESKGAFEYACKIWEEKMPPCLPLKLTVQFGKLRGGPANALSSVKPETRTDTYTFAGKALSAHIKAVFLDGYNKRDNHSYLEYANDAFINSPDATIIYNIDKIDDFSFSIDETPSDKYDFVTLALRDIAKALGFITSITANPSGGYVDVRNENITSFDEIIIRNFTSSDASQRYQQATSGNFKVSIRQNQYYNLYTPNPFNPGKSLQEFYPDSNLPFSEVLSYNFSKGMVLRDLGEDIKVWLVSNMGWVSDIAVGGGSSNENKEFSTLNVVPYKGSITGKATERANLRSIAPSSSNQVVPLWVDPDDSNVKEFLNTYCSPYDNFLGDEGKGGWFVSILKKDGTWDFVFKDEAYETFFLDTKDLNISNTDNYARTCDGFLRCRLSYCRWERDYPLYPDRIIRSGFSNFYVLDYLPQKPKAQFVKVISPMTRMGNNYTADIKIALKDLEGTDKIYVEALEEGERVPVIYEVKDFKKGYFTTNVYTDCSTKFTFRAINKNGTTYSDPLTVKPINLVSLKLNPDFYENLIKVNFVDENGVLFDKYIAKDYQIHSLNQYVTHTVQAGNMDETNIIDIESLDKGLYVLNVRDQQNKTYSTKFQK